MLWQIKAADNKSICASVAGRWSHQLFIAIWLRPGWTSLIGLLFLTFIFSFLLGFGC